MKHDARDLEIIANRKRFLRALRTTQAIQGRGSWYSPRQQAYCAMGLYYYVVKGGKVDWSECDSELGLSVIAVAKIWMWNDTGSSFAEIADKLEKANFPIYKIGAPILRPTDVLDRSAAELRRKSREAEFSETKRRYKLIDVPALAAGEVKDKEAGRITLTEWFEKYDGGPKAMEPSH